MRRPAQLSRLFWSRYTSCCWMTDLSALLVLPHCFPADIPSHYAPLSYLSDLLNCQSVCVRCTLFADGSTFFVFFTSFVYSHPFMMPLTHVSNDTILQQQLSINRLCVLACVWFIFCISACSHLQLRLLHTQLTCCNSSSWSIPVRVPYD